MLMWVVLFSVLMLMWVILFSVLMLMWVILFSVLMLMWVILFSVLMQLPGSDSSPPVVASGCLDSRRVKTSCGC